MTAGPLRPRPLPRPPAGGQPGPPVKLGTRPLTSGYNNQYLEGMETIANSAPEADLHRRHHGHDSPGGEAAAARAADNRREGN